MNAKEQLDWINFYISPQDFKDVELNSNHKEVLDQLFSLPAPSSRLNFTLRKLFLSPQEKLKKIHRLKCFFEQSDQSQKDSNYLEKELIQYNDLTERYSRWKMTGRGTERLCNCLGLTAMAYFITIFILTLTSVNIRSHHHLIVALTPFISMGLMIISLASRSKLESLFDSQAANTAAQLNRAYYQDIPSEAPEEESDVISST